MNSKILPKDIFEDDYYMNQLIHTDKDFRIYLNHYLYEIIIYVSDNIFPLLIEHYGDYIIESLNFNSFKNCNLNIIFDVLIKYFKNGYQKYKYNSLLKHKRNTDDLIYCCFYFSISEKHSNPYLLEIIVERHENIKMIIKDFFNFHYNSSSHKLNFHIFEKIQNLNLIDEKDFEIITKIILSFKEYGDRIIPYLIKEYDYANYFEYCIENENTKICNILKNYITSENVNDSIITYFIKNKTWEILTDLKIYILSERITYKWLESVMYDCIGKYGIFDKARIGEDYLANFLSYLYINKYNKIIAELLYYIKDKKKLIPKHNVEKFLDIISLLCSDSIYNSGNFIDFDYRYFIITNIDHLEYLRLHNKYVIITYLIHYSSIETIDFLNSKRLFNFSNRKDIMGNSLAKYIFNANKLYNNENLVYILKNKLIQIDLIDKNKAGYNCYQIIRKVIFDNYFKYINRNDLKTCDERIHHIISKNIKLTCILYWLKVNYNYEKCYICVERI